MVTTGADNRDPAATHHWLYEASRWLAARLGTTLVETPGAHVPPTTHPQELAEMLRPIIDELT